MLVCERELKHLALTEDFSELPKHPPASVPFKVLAFFSRAVHRSAIIPGAFLHLLVFKPFLATTSGNISGILPGQLIETIELIVGDFKFIIVNKPEFVQAV